MSKQEAAIDGPRPLEEKREEVIQDEQHEDVVIEQKVNVKSFTGVDFKCLARSSSFFKFMFSYMYIHVFVLIIHTSYPLVSKNDA
jgi:hypothetical protein